MLEKIGKRSSSENTNQQITQLNPTNTFMITLGLILLLRSGEYGDSQASHIVKLALFNRVHCLQVQVPLGNMVVLFTVHIL